MWHVSERLLSLSASSKDFILIGDFNATKSDTNLLLKDFCHIYSFKNLLKEPTNLKTCITQNALTKR